MEDEMSVIASIYVSKIKNSVGINKNSLRNNIFYIHRVEETLSSLDRHLQELIKNDFFSRQTPNWWKPLYTCEYYLRLRYKAVSSFLKHFYE